FLRRAGKMARACSLLLLRWRAAMLIFSLVASGLLLVGANLAGYSRGQAADSQGDAAPSASSEARVRPLRLVGSCVVVLVFGFAGQFVPPVVLGNAALLFLTAILCAVGGASRKAFFLSTCVATAVLYLVVGTMVYVGLSRDRDRFPFES